MELQKEKRVIENKHEINFENVVVLHTGKVKLKREFLEFINIKLNESSMHFKTDTQYLRVIYQQLLNYYASSATS